MMETSLCYLKKRINQIRKSREVHPRKCTCYGCMAAKKTIEELEKFEDVFTSELEGKNLPQWKG